CSRSAWVRLHIATLTPSWASTSAQALPRPLLAPPTMATLSCSSRSIENETSFDHPCCPSPTPRSPHQSIPQMAGKWKLPHHSLPALWCAPPASGRGAGRARLAHERRFLPGEKILNPLTMRVHNVHGSYVLWGEKAHGCRLVAHPQGAAGDLHQKIGGDDLPA